MTAEKEGADCPGASCECKRKEPLCFAALSAAELLCSGGIYPRTHTHSRVSVLVNQGLTTGLVLAGDKWTWTVPCSLLLGHRAARGPFVFDSKHGLQGHFDSRALWGNKGKTKALPLLFHGSGFLCTWSVWSLTAGLSCLQLGLPWPPANLQTHGQKMKLGSQSLNPPLCPHSADKALEAVTVAETLAVFRGPVLRPLPLGKGRSNGKGLEGPLKALVVSMWCRGHIVAHSSGVSPATVQGPRPSWVLLLLDALQACKDRSFR